MAPPLVIRNVTSTPIALKKIERFELPKQPKADGFSVNALSQNFTTLLNKATGNEKPNKVADDAQSYEQRDVDFPVEPFKKHVTDINPTERNDNDVLRLIFEADGQRYRVDVPPPTAASANLIPLDNDPRHHFTAVYTKNASHVCIVSSANLSAWMGELKDHIPLSAISMPGTHNSPTAYTALPSVRCQAVDVKTQLENGVRFLDLRLQPEDALDVDKDGLILVHSVFPISLTGTKYFREEVLKVVEEFLNQHPSETVVISFKREGTGSANDDHFGKVLRKHYANNDRWYTEPRIPKIGEVRGKIVLFRRFGLNDELRGEHEGRGWGLEADNWADNTPNNTKGDVCVQDFYEVLETENIDKKIEYCQAHLAEAAGCVARLDSSDGPKQPIFINFLTASNFWKPGCWPDKIAAKLNPNITEYIATKHHEADDNGDGSTGVVICDWVGLNGDWDLVRCIVGMNAKLLTRG